MGARLARYTGNDTYAQWGAKAYDWMVMRQYIDKDWNIYDGGRTWDECVAVEKTQFSYNTATILQAMAFMYNYVSNELCGLVLGTHQTILLTQRFIDPRS